MQRDTSNCNTYPRREIVLLEVAVWTLSIVSTKFKFGVVLGIALAIPCVGTQGEGLVAGMQAAGAPAPDLSGVWVAKAVSPMGEMEIVYRLKMTDGRITGSQGLPFGDSPIIDGAVTGDTFHFTVELESFGDIQKREVTGKIIGDTIVLTPAFPAPPPGGAGPGGTGPGGPPPGGPGAGAPPAGGGGRFRIGEVTARRGTPTPSFRAPAVDYKTLPKIELPALKDVPYNGLAKTPPMGWNSWNKFSTRIDDKTVRAIADAMVSSGMKDAGYNYVIIDDGWQGSRGPDGVLKPNPNFPDMKALGDYIHSKGLLFGTYSSPGPRTCGGFEGSYGHEAQDAAMYASWGVDYLKYDWCSASRVWKDTDMQAAYQFMGAALQAATKATGRPIVYALCQYGRANVGSWGQHVGANLWRTTEDIRDRYESMAKIGFEQSDLALYAGPGHWNDPDMLEIGNGGMSPDEYRTHFSLWAMVASPLLSGNDVRSLTPEIREILLNTEVIAVDQDPLGKGGTQIAQAGDIVVWSKPLASGDVAVALFNRGTAASKGTVAWNLLNLKKKAPAVRDLWTHTDLGKFEDTYSTTVPAHGVVMLRVSK